jgi:sugar/nucleoside kinase (ribokinase family)
VAVVGELYIDHVFSGFESWPAPGAEVVTDDYTRELGGGAATTACGLARLGRSVKLVGLIGEADAAWIGQRLAGFGVAADGLRVVADGVTGVTISVSTREDRSFFTHLGANRDLAAALMTTETAAELARARHVHFALPLSRTVAERLLPILKQAGCTTSLDVGYQPDWLGDPDNTATLAEIDHFLPNEKEAELWCGAAGEEAFFAHAARLDLVRPLLKLGARGAAGQESGTRRRAAPPAVVAVDTTGAGDAFDAGFIDALLDGAPLAERLRRACVVGALSTRAAGALSALPSPDDVKAVHDHASVP